MVGVYREQINLFYHTPPPINPRGTSKEYKYGTELDMDYNASLNILERGMAGQRLPFVPSDVEPLRKLIPVSASSIVEVGSPLPCDSWG